LGLVGGSLPAPSPKSKEEVSPLIEVKSKEDLSFAVSVKEEEKLFLDFVLVGKGEKGKDCGELVPVFSCQHCHKVHFVKKRCRLKSCPECWEWWVTNTTRKICSRLLHPKARWLNRGKRLVHLIVSPDPVAIWDYVDPITGRFNVHLLVQEALDYLYAKSNSKIAGVLIFHPFRPNELYYIERKEEMEEEDENPEKELKKWEWIRSKPNWYDYVKFSPHLHFVGYIGWLQPPDEGEKFVYKLLKNREGNYKGLIDKRDVYAVVYYVLTHTGFPKDKKNFHCYVWVGNLSYRTFRVKRSGERREGLKCKSCGGYLTGLGENLEAFFKNWLNVYNFRLFPIKWLKLQVLRAENVPFKIKMNVLEALDIWEGYKPPPDRVLLV